MASFIDGSDGDGDELQRAVFHGRVARVQQLLASSSEPRRGLLVLAAKSGQDAMCEILLQHGSDVNERCGSGMTPLMWAAHNLEAGLLKRLLSLGANPNLYLHNGSQITRSSAADFLDLNLQSKNGDATWERCAVECLALLDAASVARHGFVRARLKRPIRLVSTLLQWWARAAHRVYSPGGCGYLIAREEFEARQQEGTVTVSRDAREADGTRAPAVDGIHT